MKNEQLFKLLNTGKRDHTGVKKPSKKLFTVELWNYTGKRVLKTIKSYIMGLNEDFTVMFKPVKRFTKKQIKGLDKHDLAVQQIEAEEERRKLGQATRPTSNKSVGHKEVPTHNNGFDNWFDIIGNKEGPMKKRITLKKADGRVVGLDDYENNIF